MLEFDIQSELVVVHQKEHVTDSRRKNERPFSAVIRSFINLAAKIFKFQRNCMLVH